MAMKRTGRPWMEAPDFGRSIPLGIGLNLLVQDIEAMVAFCRDVLEARIVYSDADFAVVELLGSILMIHCDHTYLDHPMTGVVAGVSERGIGVEIRLYGADPDQAEARAVASGHVVLAGSMDKPHGIRECHIVGPEGYVFVPSLRT